MYIVQRRDSDKGQWHTCSSGGRKCRFDDIARARIAYRHIKTSEEGLKHPNRQYQILDTSANTAVD